MFYRNVLSEFQRIIRRVIKIYVFSSQISNFITFYWKKIMEILATGFKLPLWISKTWTMCRQRSLKLVSDFTKTRRLYFKTHQIVECQSLWKASLVLCIDVMLMKEQFFFNLISHRTSSTKRSEVLNDWTDLKSVEK